MQVKEVQAKYASNPEVMQREMSALYAENDVNPLAGCLPSLVQIPIFIGLYRALLKLAKENLLDEPFLWLPNLEGSVILLLLEDPSSLLHSPSLGSSDPCTAPRPPIGSSKTGSMEPPRWGGTIRSASSRSQSSSSHASPSRRGSWRRRPTR